MISAPSRSRLRVIAVLAHHRILRFSLVTLKRKGADKMSKAKKTAPRRSSRAMARTGLRMMPTSPSPPLKFRTAGFPRYGFKAGMSDRAFLNGVSVKPAPGVPSQPLSLPPPFAHFCRGYSPGSESRSTRASVGRCSRGLRPSTPGVLGSGSSYAVSFHHGFLRPHPSVSQARCDFAFAYTQRLRCAGAPRRPAGPSLLLRLCFPCMSPTLPRRSAVSGRIWARASVR